MYTGIFVSLTFTRLAKSPVAKPNLSLSKLLYFTIAIVRCTSPEWAFGEELIEYSLGVIGDRVSTNSCGVKSVSYTHLRAHET